MMPLQYMSQVADIYLLYDLQSYKGEAIFYVIIVERTLHKKLPINIPENAYWGEYIKVFFSGENHLVYLIFTLNFSV